MKKPITKIFVLVGTLVSISLLLNLIIYMFSADNANLENKVVTELSFRILSDLDYINGEPLSFTTEMFEIRKQKDSPYLLGKTVYHAQDQRFLVQWTDFNSSQVSINEIYLLVDEKYIRIYRNPEVNP